MMAAGQYRDRLHWEQRTTRTRDGAGQRADTFAAAVALWGVVENVSGGRADDKGSDREQLTATARLQGFPAVAAGDRLTDVRTGYVFTVDSVVKLATETECDLTRPRWTQGGGAER